MFEEKSTRAGKHLPVKKPKILSQKYAAVYARKWREENPDACAQSRCKRGLTSVSGTVTLLTAAIPQGLWIIRSLVGNITPSLAGMGTVATIFPMYLKDAEKGEYEGLFALGSSSGIVLNTNQGPGVSPVVSLRAYPVVTP